MEHTLRVRLLSDTARKPVRGSAESAGYDLHAAHEQTVPARGRALIMTDIAVSLPPGTYGRVAPRSGLAVKRGITTGAGVIDPDYRGNVGILLFNHGDEDFSVSVGDRVAQLILERIVTPPVITAVDDFDTQQQPRQRPVEGQEGEERKARRGSNGFGSTGTGLTVSGSPRR